LIKLKNSKLIYKIYKLQKMSEKSDED